MPLSHGINTCSLLVDRIPLGKVPLSVSVSVSVSVLLSPLFAFGRRVSYVSSLVSFLDPMRGLLGPSHPSMNP